jgi:hypothetical protein
MSYDLAVWRGPRPANDEAAGAEYKRLMDRNEQSDEPPSAAILAFAADLVARYPELGQPGDEDSPWAMSGIADDASGDFIYLTLTYPGARRARTFIAEVVHRHGLVGYDPQIESLI